MAAVTMTPDDLSNFADIPEGKAQDMIDTALARAARVAPCIRESTLSADNEAAARGVIRDAILRWNESGTGAVQQQSAGPFSMSTDTRSPRRSLFWPSEIEELQAICADHNGVTQTSGAFSITPACSDSIHQPWCSLNLGALYCSCGADIAGFPLYEYGD